MSIKTIIALNYQDLAYATQTEDGSWTTRSAHIGYRTLGLAVDPQNTDHIYIGTDGEGVLKSEDFGASWTPVGLQGQNCPPSAR
jgi:hypothetical protein